MPLAMGAQPNTTNQEVSKQLRDSNLSAFGWPFTFCPLTAGWSGGRRALRAHAEQTEGRQEGIELAKLPELFEVKIVGADDCEDCASEPKIELSHPVVRGGDRGRIPRSSNAWARLLGQLVLGWTGAKGKTSQFGGLLYPSVGLGIIGDVGFELVLVEGSWEHPPTTKPCSLTRSRFDCYRTRRPPAGLLLSMFAFAIAVIC